jgi:hypothetical protein
MLLWMGSWLLENEVIAFELFLIISRCRCQIEGQGKSVGSIIYFELIWIHEIYVITESRMCQWQNIIYIPEAEIKDLGYI